MQELVMIEMPTTPEAERAIKRAHQERAKAAKAAWRWLFGFR